MYGLLNFNILGFVSWLLSFCLGKMIWWRVLLHNGFRKNCYLNVGLKEKEGIWIHALETLLDYATEQFVEHSIFSCINMTTLRLTRYLTKKKTKQQKQNQRCIKQNMVIGVQEDKTSYHSCKHHWLVAEHCIKKIGKGLVTAGSKFYLGKGEELLDTFFFLTRP